MLTLSNLRLSCNELAIALKTEDLPNWLNGLLLALLRPIQDRLISSNFGLQTDLLVLSH